MKDVKVIEQIHNEFDNASDFILQEAQKILAEAEKQDVGKGQRLQKLGFYKTQKALQFSTIDKQIKLSHEQMDKINKMKEQYPNYKYIPLDIVEIVCKKYNLGCAQADCYTGDIPEKNLVEIEKFNTIIELEVKIHNDKMSKIYDQNTYPNLYSQHFKSIRDYYICAPRNELLLEDKVEKKGFFYVEKPIPDPIVLYPIEGHMGRGRYRYSNEYLPEGFLIITKWGLEENIDELK